MEFQHFCDDFDRHNVINKTTLIESTENAIKMKYKGKKIKKINKISFLILIEYSIVTIFYCNPLTLSVCI